MDEIIGADPAPDAAGSAAGGVPPRRLIHAAPAPRQDAQAAEGVREPPLFGDDILNRLSLLGSA
jgi:hypothetical protein